MRQQADPTIIPTPGTMSVDFEERLNYDRLREYRRDRLRRALDDSGLGALLLFDMNNIRYASSTHIGEWARDKIARFVLVARGAEPILWDFGSAARAHRLHSPWLQPENSRTGMMGLRGSVPPEAGLFEKNARMVQGLLADLGVADEPLGVDIAEIPFLAALSDCGVTVRDGQQTMLRAREIKCREEIILLSTAASMVDGVYQMIWETLKPGVRENEIVALANKMLYELGSEEVEDIITVSGERCNPHPHVFSDRLIRPGDQAFFDISHVYNGYRTCYYRTFNVGTATASQRDAYKQCREWLDASIELIKPGVATDEVARAWPAAEEFGFPNEVEAFGLQFGHGLGLALHERPIISRLNSLDHTEEIKEGMVFALETYCPATDGKSAARIEEEVVVTADGCQVLTLFPADSLMVANEY